jgi:hypothetical protein
LSLSASGLKERLSLILDQATEKADRFRLASGISGKCVALVEEPLLVVLVDDIPDVELVFRECDGVSVFGFAMYESKVGTIMSAGSC